jgi:pimeloyl-ACP methyl ester carboxylesterase
MTRRSIAGLALAGTLVVAGCSIGGAASPSTPPASSSGAAASTAPSASVAALPKEFNELIDIGGGRKIHLFCFGEAPAGTPTVVAESGLGGTYAAWTEIFYGVAAQTRICAYDRAGLGTSDPASEPVRTSQDMADDLDALLTAAKIEGPYVFVTHSMGIWTVELYAKAHPDNVKAVVVLDPRGAEVSEQWLAALPPKIAGEPEGVAANRADLTDFEGDPSANEEHLDLIAAPKEVEAVAEPAEPLFGDAPVAVLSAANSPDSWSDLPATLQPIFATIWFDAQKAIAAESTKGTFVTVEGTEHEIQFEKPDVVVEQILDFVDKTAS